MATRYTLGKVLNNSNLSTFADADTAILPGTVSSSDTQQLTILSGSGALILGSDVQLATGTTLSTIGTAMINLPSLFNINSVPVSANVTAANLNTLTGGSNADSLHTHTASTSISITGQTLWATPANGEVGYISANNTWAKARADSNTTVGALGAYSGVSGSLVTIGEVGLLFVPGLTLAAGDVVYLSASTAGKVTNIAPSSAGQYEYAIARLLSAASYDNVNGSVQSCIWDRKIPILIA